MIRTSTRSFALVASIGLALAATASANTFSVSGPGGSIPDAVGTPGTWPTTYTGTPFTSSVRVVRPVTSLTRVRVSGLTHTWRGDLHFLLMDPAGAAYNIVVRPGSNGTTVGDSGNYLTGVYDFEVTGASVAAGAADIGGGTYAQFFNAGTGVWTGGGATNTALSAISGPAGLWTLHIRDWFAADVGGITGWTLEGTDNNANQIDSYCGAGDPNVTQPCQGANGAPGNGCENSGATGGASLTFAGSASLSGDTLVLTQSGELATSLSIVLQGDNIDPAGVQFGDGVRCTVGNLKRLYTKNAVGGVVVAPAGGDPSISAQSAALLDPISAGNYRSYQVYYRDPASVSGLNFNVGNALKVNWIP
jgi:subtilisin-like proprotein convertase family protein